MSNLQTVQVETFLSWAVKHECIDVLDAAFRKKESDALISTELAALQGDYGEVHFEDLVSLIFSEKKRLQRGDHRWSKVKRTFRRAVGESIDRLDLLERGIATAFERNRVFPQLTPKMLVELVVSAEVENYYVRHVLIDMHTCRTKHIFCSPISTLAMTVCTFYLLTERPANH